MKKWLGVLAVLVLAAGCEEKFYYNPDRTLEEARQDWRKCNEELLRVTADGSQIKEDLVYQFFEDRGDECMAFKKYKLVPLSKMPAEVRTEADSVGHIRYWIAGK